MGGMASLRRLLLDHLLDAERQNDRVQESLGNVVAAHAVQTYLGSYGPMIHPVGACATAAVCLEVAYDKIVAGQGAGRARRRLRRPHARGHDRLRRHGRDRVSEDLEAMGLAPHEASRANDIRRAGFVEAQGGGAQLVVRGDVALALGLPVRGVLAYAGSFADGLHTSIPAPGLGALAAARPLRAALDRHGLTADDIGVVSKHDTSTEHERPQRGRPARPAPGPRSTAPRATRCSSSPRRRSPATPRAAPRPGSSTASCACSRPAASPATATWRASIRSMREQPPPGARRPPDHARRAAAGRADRQPRLRSRVRDPRRRAPRHVPRGDRPGAARGLLDAGRPPSRRGCPPPAGDARSANRRSSAARASSTGTPKRRF